MGIHAQEPGLAKSEKQSRKAIKLSPRADDREHSDSEHSASEHEDSSDDDKSAFEPGANSEDELKHDLDSDFSDSDSGYSSTDDDSDSDTGYIVIHIDGVKVKHSDFTFEDLEDEPSVRFHIFIFFVVRL